MVISVIAIIFVVAISIYFFMKFKKLQKEIDFLDSKFHLDLNNETKQLNHDIERIDDDILRFYFKLNDEIEKIKRHVHLENDAGAADGSKNTDVLANDLQKLMEYSPSKKERQRRKHKKDGDK